MLLDCYAAWQKHERQEMLGGRLSLEQSVSRSLNSQPRSGKFALGLQDRLLSIALKENRKEGSLRSPPFGLTLKMELCCALESKLQLELRCAWSALVIGARLPHNTDVIVGLEVARPIQAAASGLPEVAAEGSDGRIS